MEEVVESFVHYAFQSTLETNTNGMPSSPLRPSPYYLQIIPLTPHSTKKSGS